MEPPRPPGFPPLSVCLGVGVPKPTPCGVPRPPQASLSDSLGSVDDGVRAVRTLRSGLSGGLFDVIKEDDTWESRSEDGTLGGTIKIAEGRSFSKCSRTSGTPLVARAGPSGNVGGLGFQGGDDQFQLTASFDCTLSSPSVVSGKSIKWVRGETIGRGSMGVVFQAMNQATGQVIAVKEVAINPTSPDDISFKDQLTNEIRICKDLCHPRIVQYLGDDFIGESIFIYLEYMAGGSMADVLQQFGMFEESLTAVYSKELLEGLDYLHSREPPVVHRDIKSANVLVGLDARVKLSDFGCSKRQLETMSHTIKGSIPWMAPEVINDIGYGRKADIWSFGCVVIEMVTARGPWGKFDNPMAAMVKIGMSKETPPIPSSLSGPCQTFIRLCVQRDKESRPTASDLLTHEFVSDLLAED